MKVVVQQIIQYHNAVVQADKTIADTAKQQIEAAWNCGNWLRKAKAECPSNGWGKWCKENLPQLSTSTIQRYILLSEKSDLTKCVAKYETLNQAYIGEGITGEPQQRVTVKAAPNERNRLTGKVKGGESAETFISKLHPRFQAQAREQLQMGTTSNGKIEREIRDKEAAIKYQRHQDRTAKHLDNARLIELVPAVLRKLKDGLLYASPEGLAKDIQPIVEWFLVHASLEQANQALDAAKKRIGENNRLAIMEKPKASVDFGSSIAELSKSTEGIPLNPQTDEALAA